MFAVSRTKGIINVDVCIRSQSLGKFFLAGFHGILCLFVSGISLIYAHRLAFFFRIEAKIFKQKDFARFESSGSFGGFCAIGSKLNGHTQMLSNSFGNLTEREFRINLTFGFTHVAHDDE
ncbi:hypothetical protein IMSAGC014_01187 [Bacteroidaceae bacterium]|nr:hypothetical protein IMSAGC014_01187 [Bacteroidaceae bacterium]